MVKVAISNNNCFTAMYFDSCIRTCFQADKVVRESYHVVQLGSQQCFMLFGVFFLEAGTGLV
jgi:hypothetical protein